jgi:hypothetical protein
MKTKLFRLSAITMLVGVLCAFSMAFITGCNKEVKSVSADTTRTQMQIINATDSAVVVYVTLGATEGCLQSIMGVPFITDSISLLAGYFILKGHDSTAVWSPDSLGFNGVISFNTQPINCATPQFPNGVNIFEFIINNSFQSGNPQETVDISCVAGTSCTILAELRGGNAWNAGKYDSITDIKNNIEGKNSGLIGVFPYGCDTCTGAKNPPACDSISIDKQIEPICTVQRNAVGSGGGIVRVIYLGNLVPLK